MENSRWVPLLKRVSFLPLVGIVFLEWSLDRIPQLYQLTFKCVNAQLHENKASVKTYYSLQYEESDFMKVCVTLPWNSYFLFFPWVSFVRFGQFQYMYGISFHLSQLSLNRVRVTEGGTNLSEIMGVHPPQDNAVFNSQLPSDIWSRIRWSIWCHWMLRPDDLISSTAYD